MSYYTESKDDEETKFFCLVTVQVAENGGTKQELRQELISTDNRITEAQDLFWAACNQTVDYYMRYEEKARTDITILDFKFWPNKLKEDKL